ncbi:larval serum protein 1 gamma chain [Drosophila ficusphila]|uniref:larval serum protein 1 gamma chain n=1 Tax=Drosophila ficusphila TaxID=30025 RepID=UPI0007E6E1D8|nr:larval serum protein 1 gamma chain [Drosophila ficusphila]
MRFWVLLSLFFINIYFEVLGNGIGNPYFLEKQRFLLEILHHVQEPLMNDQWRLLGEQLVTDKDQYVVFNDHMVKFFNAFNLGNLLPRKEYYNPLYADHYQQTLGLYHFFYNTRDWYTLWQNICWARVHINPGIFVHALTQVLFKREDYQALIMPKVYEIWPEIYHDEKTISKARKFNFANWIRFENASDIREIIPQRVEPQSLMGDLRSSLEWFQAMSDVNILRIKQQKKRNKIQYLLEDIGWQSYWYNLNVGIVLSDDNSYHLQEWWYYKLNQILARYKLELYSQKLPYKKLTPVKFFTKGRKQLKEEFPKTSKKLIKYLEKLERKVADAISFKSFHLPNGSFINLEAENNWLIGLEQLFPYDCTQLTIKESIQPELLPDIRTLLRSENFYFYADRILNLYRWYRQVFSPSNHTLYIPSDLRIEDLRISPLITYDQPVDVDLSNVLHAKHFYLAGQFVWPFTLQERQMRLQHKDFRYNLQVSSNKTQSTIFRVFLTTSERGSIQREPFYQLDSFLRVLYPGLNKISRESKEFGGLIGDHISYTELHQFVKLAEREEFDFPLNISTPNCGFPSRLILPRGGNGNPVRMRLLILATVYDFKARQGNELNCDFAKGVSRWDELPLAFPFDRFLEDDTQSMEISGDHVFWKDVEILHEEHNA